VHDDPLPSGLTEEPAEFAALLAAPGAPYTASAVFTTGWRVLSGSGSSVEKIPDFLSTNPATEERLQRLRREIR